jgi:hypothetical protein
MAGVLGWVDGLLGFLWIIASAVRLELVFSLKF